MLTIGLTGGIGSGKSTVATLFSELGVTVIDTDQLARDVTQPGQPAFDTILNQFGKQMLLPNGYLNRTALRRRIFADIKERHWLEKLLHPLIRREMKRHIDYAISPYCIVVIPLLVETDPNPLIHRILVVDIQENIQLQRSRLRDNATEEEIKAIMNTQIARNIRLAAADDVIENNGGISDLVIQVNKLHELYTTLAQKKKN